MSSPSRMLDAAYALVREPDDTERVRTQKSIVVVAAAIGVVITSISIVLGLATGVERSVVVALTAFVALIVAIVATFVVTKRGMRFAFTIIMVGNLAVSWFGTRAQGGIVPSGANALWGIVAPVLALLVFGARAALVWFAAFFAVLMVSIFARPAGDDTSTETLAAFASVLGGVSIFVMLLFLYFVRERDRAQAVAELERARSDALLHDILPDEIADRLKDGETVIADRFAEATVLFADISDFTPLSATMRPDDLVLMLDEVFRAFDRIATRLGVEKIKTIGDCYMVAAGVPVPRADHAPAIAELALSMLEVVDGRRFGGRRLQFRIGIASGPVVAGVIGAQKFLYDLWGDTVNTASRMESHGADGTIQLTETTAALLGDGYCVERLADVAVKGKGPMPVFRLVARAAPPRLRS